MLKDYLGLGAFHQLYPWSLSYSLGPVSFFFIKISSSTISLYHT